MAKNKPKLIPKTVLKLPDLQQSKSAVLNRVGNWLTAAQSKRLLDAFDLGALRGKRDCASPTSWEKAAI
jgi:hypothetical protein